VPDLSHVLAGVLGDKGASVFQATVDAVGEGVLTLHLNGGQFTEVPYLPGGWGFASPNIGDICYVLAQKDWGIFAIGKPAPGPERSGDDSAVVTWDPFARARWNQETGTWTIPSTDAMPIRPGTSSSSLAVYFFDLADIDWPGTAVGSASFYLELGPVDQSGADADNPVFDNAYVEIGLTSSTGPNGVFTELPNLNAYYKRPANGSSEYVSIPLDWAGRLLAGEAHGVYVRTEDYPLTVSGPGTLRFTTL